MNSKDEKHLIREQIKSELNKIPQHEKHILSSLIKEKVLEREEFLSSTIVLIYYPLLSEVDTKSIIEASFSLKKKVALPSIQGDELVFHLINKGYEESLTKSAFGSLEPSMNEVNIELKTSSHALLIVPGLAFSLNKERLGRSKGFYDRFINKYREYLKVMGICFDVQLLDTIVVDDWDERVDCIITDKRVIE
jgi:5-formyltetrahydrofolate cyclo-ligase